MKSRLNLAATVLALSFLAVGCGGGGGGDDGPIAVSRTNLPPVSVTTTLAEAVASQPFAFANGVPDFGTTSATTVTFAGTSAAPTFAIASGGSTASGALSIGSCIFTITSSTFPSTSPLRQGATITVNPCTLKVATLGAPADGSTADRSVTLVLRNTDSTPRALPIRISASGEVTINGRTLGTVTLGTATGATGGA
jgi:hypothetical protein